MRLKNQKERQSRLCGMESSAKAVKRKQNKKIGSSVLRQKESPVKKDVNA